MAMIALSDRDRFSLYAHLNPLPLAGRSEQRKMDRLWTTLKLDAISAFCEGRETTRSSEFAVEKTDYEITSDQRDFLTELLDKPMTTALSRLLLPIGDALLKSRDG